ncbi:hypothetical protein CAP36_15635 [Chitinophagaceae bacterium IBVUCB2]|nr:hypothetical protein CAP36_15635 [Chitinophagaceae bacterium IBVUCB2]
MEANQLQQELFRYLKTSLPPHLSMVDDLSDLLDVGADSVYRRIRGEKPISLLELKKICEHYHLSLDQLLQLQTDTVVFRAPDLKTKNLPFTEQLRSILMQVKFFNSFRKKQILYICKDMPIWQFYLSRELAAFKTFFWAKTINKESAYADKNFSIAEFDFDETFEIGRQIIANYNQIPCVELWNMESINSTLSQINFYKESGQFKNESDIEAVIASFESTLDHLKLQAERGIKFMPGDSEVLYKSPVQLYINEVVIGSNTILTELDDIKLAFIPYNVFSFIMTKDPRFNESVFEGFETLKSKSTLISGTGEKERNRFFKILKDRVNNLR